MISAQVLKTLVSVTRNSTSQDLTHPADHVSTSDNMTPGFKPFINTLTIIHTIIYISNNTSKVPNN